MTQDDAILHGFGTKTVNKTFRPIRKIKTTFI